MNAVGLAFGVALLAICSSCSDGVIQSKAQGHAVKRADEILLEKRSSQTEAIVALINRLSSEQESDRIQSEAALVEMSLSSQNARQEVVDRLIQAASQPDLAQKILHSRKMFLLWTSVAHIFGAIKAEEALDLLIGCLYCNSGEASSSAAAYPALRAAIRIGPSAVPKLSVALLSSTDPFTRQYAALALSSIGGKNAKAALENALLTEKDQSVAANIKLSLAAMGRTQQNQ